MKFRKLLALLLFLTALMAAFYIYNQQPVRLQTSPVPPPPPPKAYLNAEWGMSGAQIEIANQTTLQDLSVARKLYTPKEGIDAARYRALEQPGARLLDRDAMVYYAFFDDRLFAYYVFVSDTDGDSLDDQMRAFLASAFGPGYSDVEDEGSLRMIWHNPEIIVNYWLYEESYSLRPKFSAAYGVVYRPMEDAIH